MSQPCNLDCNLELPGKLDPELNEFWVGNPWEIFEKHNLSAFERNRLFINVHGRDFLDISSLSGADNDGDSRSAIAADFNHDGLIDIALRQAGGGPLVIYENRFEKANYAQITLRGAGADKRSNRLAIGAKLTAHIGKRQVVRGCNAINSFKSQSPLTVHFGLGEAQQIDKLTVQWPSGLQQDLHRIPAGQHVVVTEGVDDFFVSPPGQLIPPHD